MVLFLPISCISENTNLYKISKTTKKSLFLLMNKCNRIKTQFKTIKFKL